MNEILAQSLHLLNFAQYQDCNELETTFEFQGSDHCVAYPRLLLRVLRLCDSKKCGVIACALPRARFRQYQV